MQLEKLHRMAIRLALLCIVMLSGVETGGADETAVSSLGFTTVEPSEGHYVPVEGGFLIPYTARIPGTDVSFEMVPVPGGVARIGSPAGEEAREEDEGPVVRVQIPPFWIGKYEVTWTEYKQYMALVDLFEKFDDLQLRQVTDENRIDAVTAPSKLYDPSFTFSTGDDPRQPAVSMSQYAAKQYTKWLSLLSGEFYRLPREVEWEYACRAGTTTAYSFGDDPADLDDHGWYYENADDETHEVGSKKPNPWGLYDMHGNAAEWVLDAYDPNWYAQLEARGEVVDVEQAVNWPTMLYPRVVRGGGWDDDPEGCRSASRRPSDDEEWRSYDPNTPKSPWWFASDASQSVGFRIVRPYEVPPEEQRSKYWDADVEEIQRVADRRIDEEGRGRRGLVDPELPEAARKLQSDSQ